MDELDERFIETFRKDPERAIAIIKIILAERQKAQDIVPSPAA
jgi:hypothetical protein